MLKDAGDTDRARQMLAMSTQQYPRKFESISAQSGRSPSSSYGGSFQRAHEICRLRSQSKQRSQAAHERPSRSSQSAAHLPCNATTDTYNPIRTPCFLSSFHSSRLPSKLTGYPDPSSPCGHGNGRMTHDLAFEVSPQRDNARRCHVLCGNPPQ